MAIPPIPPEGPRKEPPGAGIPKEDKWDKQAKHPLLAKRISTACGWKEKKKRWDEEMARDCPDAANLNGILHQLFFDGAYPENICFCLELADGYDSKSFFNQPSTVWWYPPREVAKKAWKILCDNFFKNTVESPYPPSWVELVTDEQVFKKILWFFSPQKEGRIGSNLTDLKNRRKGHHASIARTFLEEFIRFVWRFDQFGKFSGIDYEVARKIFREARPQIIEIAAEIGDLNFLLNRDYYLTSRYGEFDVDDTSMSKLEELTLMKELWDGKEHRKPQSVEEALYHGSYPARVLILLRTLKTEWERERNLKEAEAERQEAEEKIARLSGEKK